MEEQHMSESTNPEAAETTTQQGDPAELGEGGKKALEAERTARKAAEKAAADLQAKLEGIERANESELDKARREAQEFREQAQQAAAEAIRFRIAAEKGITDNVDLILTATDEDTMRRQADLWASRTPEPTAGPRPDLTQGGSGAPLALNSDGLEDALRSKLGI